MGKRDGANTVMYALYGIWQYGTCFYLILSAKALACLTSNLILSEGLSAYNNCCPPNCTLDVVIILKVSTVTEIDIFFFHLLPYFGQVAGFASAFGEGKTISTNEPNGAVFPESATTL